MAQSRDDVVLPPHAPLSPASARQRYMLLTALRWLPSGLWQSVLVLLVLARGHSLAAAGAVLALLAVAAAVLELPTGGLADVIGRRSVLLVASALSAAGLFFFAVARPFWQFLIAIALISLGRALASGPLEAWYVDTVHLTDPAADLRPGLGSAYSAGYAALSVGAITGGLLPLLASTGEVGGDGPVIRLSVPVLVASAAWVLHGVGVHQFVTETTRPAARTSQVLRDSARTIRSAVGLAGRSAVLRLLVLSGALFGAAGYAVEVLMPPEVAATLTDPSKASLVYGTLLGVSYAGGALGAGLSARLAMLVHSTAGGAMIGLLVAAACVGSLAAPVGLMMLAVLFLLYQVALGTVQPLQSTLLHAEVTAASRATAVSLLSLALHAGGAIGGLLLSGLADAEGLPAGWIAVGCVLAFAAVPLLGCRAAEHAGARHAQR